MHSILEIKSLSLPIHIGLSEEERHQAQEIRFHITIGFLEAQEQGNQDQLENFVCYNDLCEKIKQFTKKRTFSFIEKLAQDILKQLRELLPAGLQIKVCVHKVCPPVSNLTGGVFYTCGDLF